jgi:hypothetical protein
VAEAVGEHGPVLDRDHEHEGEREEAQDLPDREASGEARGEVRGEAFDRHIGRGFPRRTNVGLRARGQRLTRRARHRVARHRVVRLGQGCRFGERHRFSLDLN